MYVVCMWCFENKESNRFEDGRKVCKDCRSKRKYELKRARIPYKRAPLIREFNDNDEIVNQVCTKCREKKDIEHFAKDRKSFHGKCKDCFNREKRENPRIVLQSRKANLRVCYGLTLDEYNAMYNEQGGVCKICGGVSSDGTSLAVDHDHSVDFEWKFLSSQEKRKYIRGLLCRDCNTGVAMFKDDIDKINKAIKYLNEYKIKNVII